jgi:hypothetical protein
MRLRRMMSLLLLLLLLLPLLPLLLLLACRYRRLLAVAVSLSSRSVPRAERPAGIALTQRPRAAAFRS